ncbi:MAG: site-2 protease family protein [Elusimicrobiales bacterium]|nr:site-2 protease family protein [Elusimicrobiales bacterium]
MPALVFSVIIHEYAHGYVAYKKGDDTAYLMGRLTLNPLPHLDLVGSLIVPLVTILSGIPVIGWAKPVPINPYRMYEYNKSIIYVSLAGPVANILLSFFSAILLTIMYYLSVHTINFFLPLIYIFQYLIVINLVLAFFNLFPIYPLDGGQVFMNLLPYRYREKYEKIIPYGIYIIIFLVITGLIKFWIVLPLKYFLHFYKILGLSV